MATLLPRRATPIALHQQRNQETHKFGTWNLEFGTTSATNYLTLTIILNFEY